MRSLRIGFVLLVIFAGAACGSDKSHTPQVLRVDSGSSINEVVQQAKSGDIVIIAPGTYNESVKVAVEGITIRGEDRNTVILDGQDKLPNGIAVAANGVAIENLTVHSYTQNGVLFNGTEAVAGDKGVDPEIVYGTGDNVLSGFRVSYVTAYNNGLYGIYAFASRDGLVEHSYVSGHPDSGVYIGQCKPCNTVIRDVTAERNAIGYYGTNSSGDMYVIESTFINNRLGIAPNSQRAERLAPQGQTVVAGNLVVDNDDPTAPPIANGYFGVGIAVGGGTENLVIRNRVEGNSAAGIAVISMNEFLPLGNRIEENALGGNGIDLVYAPDGASDAGENCFASNTFSSSQPDEIESVLGCDSGANFVPRSFTIPVGPQGGDYRDTPAPPDQTLMPPSAMSAIGGVGALSKVDINNIHVPKR